MQLKKPDMMLKSAEYGKLYDWDKWYKEIPALKFPEEWEIQVIPPFAGAVIRFVAKYKSKSISVYLDCYENLGYFGSPHWEAYPIKDNNKRFHMEDVTGLISAMREEFKEKKIDQAKKRRSSNPATPKKAKRENRKAGKKA